MNVRSISPKVYLPQEKEKTEAQQGVQKEVSVTTDYKEKEGRNSRDGQESDHERNPLSDEEMEKVVARLKELSGFKKNHLSIRLKRNGKKRILCIEDSSGQLVRRISESDLWTLLESRDKVKGQIFDQAI